MVNTSSRFIFDILRYISTADGPVGISQISRDLNLAPTTTHRGIKTLESTGYIVREAYAAEYIIGTSAARLSHAVLARFTIRDLAMPFLRQLVNLTGENVSLNVSIGWYCVRLVSVKGSQEIGPANPVGRITEIDEGIGAKCILACLEPDEVKRFLRLRRPEITKARTNALSRELWEISWRGFAYHVSDDSQFDAVAFPILGSPVPRLASIYIEGPRIKSFRDESHSDFEMCKAIVQSLEKLIASNPTHYRNPYAHIDSKNIFFDKSIVTTSESPPSKNLQRTGKNRSMSRPPHR
jgi:DNA-binding IclR family transcriptional regulator